MRINDTSLHDHDGRSIRRAIPGVIALLAGISLATPAMAQSDETDFSGFRVEALGGYDNTGVDFDDDAFGGGKQSQSGFLYGIAAGYDFQTGPMSFGIDVEFSDATSGDQFDLQGIAADGQAVAATANVDVGGDFYIGGRAGYVVSPGILLYLRGGYTHEKVDIDGSGTKAGTPFTFDDGIGLDGFRLGVGSEIKLTDMIFGRVEYRYSNYNNGNLSIGSNDVNLDAMFEDIDVVRHQGVVGVGIRF
ncbi:outer membrane protein [Sphingomonas sp. LaA6.9]|uniref:outer membrane protein n=1 Tax=Sphingomonas sp. LaA6.9 TaxID=2919914 RepID=UPI001F4FC370|nr:porin family protein [Sphingomonas sp. LaA6.9]MCJ8158508.1 porin family protein [Sphingomonas sp. LaA6.9]